MVDELHENMKDSEEIPKHLNITNLSKDFGSLQVLRDVSFGFEKGASVAITGPSGSGKSTLLHVIGTLEEPTSGSVEINGTDPFSLSEPDLAQFRNDVIGFVFQDHHLLPQYSVLENVLIPTLAFNNINPDTSEEAKRLILRVGLIDRILHRPAELSGGERQRVAIARALINRPSILLCDEPTGNLDTNTAAATVDLLFELHYMLKNILIVVTHNLELASRFENRLDLRDGVCSEITTDKP